MNGRLESRKWGFLFLLIFSLLFLPDISAGCQFVEGRERGEKTCRGEWTFFSWRHRMFPTASSSSLAGLAAAFGKRKMFSFLFIHYTAHIATMYRLYSGVGNPQWRFRRHAFSLYYLKIGSDESVQQVQWRMEEKSPIFARTTQTRRHDASNAYYDRSTPKPKRLGGEQPL